MNTLTQLDAAIRAHCTHDAGALADPGTEALIDQALLPTQPADLDAPVQTPAHADPQAELASPALCLVAAVALVVVAAALSALWPWGHALPLP
ncbi:MAG: hypothetical protein J0M00_17625 [Burkholderiales bacterium]|nr:hypothetical protein [Burkholderiales bacterium]